MPKLIPDDQKEQIISTITQAVIYEPYQPAIEALKQIQTTYLLPASDADQLAILEDFINHVRSAHGYFVTKAAKAGLLVAHRVNARRFRQHTDAGGVFMDPLQERRYNDLRIMISMGDKIYADTTLRECAAEILTLLSLEFPLVGLAPTHSNQLVM